MAYLRHMTQHLHTLRKLQKLHTTLVLLSILIHLLYTNGCYKGWLILAGEIRSKNLYALRGPNPNTAF